MQEKELKNRVLYIYDEKGADKTSEQIIDAYNNGVIDREDGRYDNSEMLTEE